VLSGQTDRTVQSRIAKTIHKTTQYQEVSALNFEHSPFLYRRHLACILSFVYSFPIASEDAGKMPAVREDAGETPAVQNDLPAGGYIGWVRVKTVEVAKTGRFVGQKRTMARILCLERVGS